MNKMKADFDKKADNGNAEMAARTQKRDCCLNE